MNRAAIGLLGGTFDPIHHGHLRLALEAQEQCALHQVRFLPSGTPPHRATPKAAATSRRDMVRLAIQGQPGFMADEREVTRTTPCYTVDTLTELRTELGDKTALCLILGGDAFLQLHTWHEWKRLFELAHIIVLQRAGTAPLGNAMQQAHAELQAEYIARLVPSAKALHESACGSIFVADMPALEISATDIRRRCADSRSIRYLVPDTVAHYIENHSLYRTC